MKASQVADLSKTYTLSGFITDSKTGESIPGVNIYLSVTDYGSSTDIDGYFIILDILFLAPA